MRILVTGGCGFIGSHLVERLQKEPCDVEIVDNMKRAVARGAGAGTAKVREIDIRDRDGLRAAMAGIDVVYHLAAQSNVLGAIHDTDYAFTSNIVGTYNVLACARECGVQRLIFTSSREVYGEVTALPVPEHAPVAPKNVYGATKASGELLCRSLAGDSLRVTILRLANVYGPRDEGRVIPLFVAQAVRGEPLTIFGEGKLLDFVWVGDVVDALAGALERDVPGPLNIGSGHGTTLAELAREIVRLTGSGSVVRQAPARCMEVDRFVADIAGARDLLEFRPSAPLRHLPAVLEDVLQGDAVRRPGGAAGGKGVACAPGSGR